MRWRVGASGCVLDPGDGFVTAEQYHHIEYTGCDRAACQSGAQGAGKLAELCPVRLSGSRDDPFQRLARPANISQLRRQFVQYTNGYRIKRCLSLFIPLKRALAQDKPCFLNKIGERLRPCLDQRHRVQKRISLTRGQVRPVANG